MTWCEKSPWNQMHFICISLHLLPYYFVGILKGILQFVSRVVLKREPAADYELIHCYRWTPGRYSTGRLDQSEQTVFPYLSIFTLIVFICKNRQRSPGRFMGILSTNQQRMCPGFMSNLMWLWVWCATAKWRTTQQNNLLKHLRGKSLVCFLTCEDDVRYIVKQVS